MKALHYTTVADRIKDFVLNKRMESLTLYVEKWTEDDECSYAHVEIKKGEGVSISATYHDGDEVLGMLPWDIEDSQCRCLETYCRVYNWVANKLANQFNWFFAEKEHTGLYVARGDHKTGWYQIGNRVANLYHSDWCVFDEDGNVACSWEGRPFIWSTKKVAQEFANNPGKMFEKWAMPISDPLANMIHHN